MSAICSSETSVGSRRARRCFISEESIIMVYSYCKLVSEGGGVHIIRLCGRVLCFPPCLGTVGSNFVYTDYVVHVDENLLFVVNSRDQFKSNSDFYGRNTRHSNNLRYPICNLTVFQEEYITLESRFLTVFLLV
jgi:hypothetical protein